MECVTENDSKRISFKISLCLLRQSGLSPGPMKSSAIAFTGSWQHWYLLLRRANQLEYAFVAGPESCIRLELDA